MAWRPRGCVARGGARRSLGLPHVGHGLVVREHRVDLLAHVLLLAELAGAGPEPPVLVAEGLQAEQAPFLQLAELAVGEVLRVASMPGRPLIVCIWIYGYM